MKSDSVVLLHISIISPVDLGRLQRELYNLENSLDARASRAGIELQISKQLDNLVKSSGIDLTSGEQRRLLTHQLQTVRRTAPVVSLTFSSSPDEASLSMLVKWFREFGHPNTLLEINVNPSIGGGCLLRTATKNFDFSYATLLRKMPLQLQAVNTTR